MHYEDFELQIQSAPGGELSVRVRSPAGETEGRVKSADEIEPLARALGASGRARPVPERHLVSDGPTAGEAPSMKVLGGRLFEALFGGEVSVLFYDSLARVGPDGGLRIKLRFDPTDPRVAEIASLPWERLYAERLGGYLALSRRTPVVRYVEVPRPSRPATLPDVLRILVMISSPRGLPPLDLEAERRKIEASWADLDGVEVTFLEEPTRERLGEALRDAHRVGRPHHVLHFMGHGQAVPESGTGELLFVDGSGGPRPVAGEELSRELADFPDLRFVFLNACETGAAPSRSDGVEPFGGVASALVRTGAPAVVAMQRPISDAAAIELARVIYGRIAAGDPVDTAVTEGRLALDRRPETADEWDTPALFLRLPDGRLYERRSPGSLTKGRLAAGLVGILATIALGVWLFVPPRPADPCRETVPAEAAELVDRAIRSLGDNDHRTAAGLLSDALGLVPDYARAHSVLGFLEMDRGRPAASRASFARAVDTRPRCAAHHVNLGAFHLARGEYGEAERHLGRALELDPDHLAATAALGRAYLLHGAPERARPVLEAGLRRAEGNETPPDRETLYPLHANLGRAALELGQLEDALEHLERARDLVPPEDVRYSEVVSDLAEARAAAGQSAGACAELAALLPLGRDPHLPGEAEAVALADRLGCPEAR